MDGSRKFYQHCIDLSEQCNVLADIDSVGLEAAVNYIYSGKLSITSVNKNVIKKSLLPGKLTIKCNGTGWYNF